MCMLEFGGHMMSGLCLSQNITQTVFVWACIGRGVTPDLLMCEGSVDSQILCTGTLFTLLL